MQVHHRSDREERGLALALEANVETERTVGLPCDQRRPGRLVELREDRIRRLGLEADVEAVGWVDDPLQYAARAWAFVLPSDEEGFAQVLTEAMSVDCPVITTDARGGGPRFVTKGGRYGLLVPRGDRGALSEAMIEILDPHVRERYAALGRRRVGELSPEASANALIGFLSQRLGVAA